MMSTTTTPAYRRDIRLADALDSTPIRLTQNDRVRIFWAVYRPTRDNWYNARLVRVTGPTEAHPRGLSLWAVMMLHHKPTAEQIVQVPTGAQIIEGLENAGEYK